MADPVVNSFVTALNAGDKAGVHAVLADGATMSDDGTDRDLDGWLESEAFTSNGRMGIESTSADGLALVANYTNDRWGAMRTRWKFTVDEGRITRFETGQA